MNWKQEAKEQLGSYECSRNALKSMRLMAKELEMDLYSPRSQTMDTPVRTDSVYEDVRLNRLVKLEQIRGRILQTQTWLEAMDSALGVLSQEERLVLSRFFIRPQKGAADQLCQDLSIERTAVYRLRDKCLERFTLALYGISQ